MSIDPESNAELEKLIGYWEGVCHTEGGSSIMSTFPKGEHTIGRRKIVKERDGTEAGFTLETIHQSDKLKNLSHSNWIAIAMIIQDRAAKEFGGFRPDSTDIVAVSDLMSGSNDMVTLNSEVSEMIGVINMTKRKDDAASMVSHCLVMPRKYLKDFVQNLKDNPILMRKLTGKLLSGIDEVVPRQDANKIILSVNVRKSKALGPILATVERQTLQY